MNFILTDFSGENRAGRSAERVSGLSCLAKHISLYFLSSLTNELNAKNGQIDALRAELEQLKATNDVSSFRLFRADHLPFQLNTCVC